jgi:3-hydroxybutyryl-CoA dehydrogenase
MHILVHCSEAQKKELVTGAPPGNPDVVYTFSFAAGQWKDADVIIDLLFEKEHTDYLVNEQQLVIINSVIETLDETSPDFVRINGWPGFLSSTLIEASGKEEKRAEAEKVLKLFGKNVEWMRDEPGFITARVVSMIINEAYFALEEGVSTKEEIDVAMKLGTAYPFGPFEWAQKIGKSQLVRLLSHLKKDAGRYQPAPLLVKEADI